MRKARFRSIASSLEDENQGYEILWTPKSNGLNTTRSAICVLLTCELDAPPGGPWPVKSREIFKVPCQCINFEINLVSASPIAVSSPFYG